MYDRFKDSFSGKINKIQMLFYNFGVKGKIIRPIYYIYPLRVLREITEWEAYNFDVNRYDDTDEINDFDYPVAKIYDFEDRRFFYLGFHLSGWRYDIATEEDFINKNFENFKSYYNIKDILLEWHIELINCLKDLTKKLPDSIQSNDAIIMCKNIGQVLEMLKNVHKRLPAGLQSSDFIKMLKNIEAHFESDIGGIMYEDAKSDFESRL